MKWGQRSSRLRFTGRTPSLQVPGMGGRLGRPPLSGEARVSRQRRLAWGLVAGCLVLSLLVAFGRQSIGALPAVLPVSVQSLADFVPRARLESLPSGWWHTALALPVLLGAGARESGVRGLITLWLLTLVGFGAWHLAARIQGWQRPQMGVVALLALQGWAAAFYGGQLLPPARVLRSNALPWAFGVRTVRSGALLAPATQIARLDARGLRGLCFGDETPLDPAERAALQKLTPSVLLVNGASRLVAGRSLAPRVDMLAVGARSGLSGSNEAETTRLARAQGALVFSATGRKVSAAAATSDNAPTGVLASQTALTPGQNAIADATPLGELRAWTLLPPQARDVGRTFATLKKGRVALAFAPQPRGAWRGAWGDLSTAQKLNALLWLVALFALTWLWGSQAAPDAYAPLGPDAAWSFLRRRRLPPRLLGFLLMSGAVLGSLWACEATLHLPSARLTLAPLQVLLVWLLCDLVFSGARLLWRRKT